MNFRFIIFVVITSLSLFFVNQYFAPTPTKHITEQTTSSEELEVMPAASIGALPLFPLYTSETGSEIVSYGFAANKHTYLLPTGALPSAKKTLFVKNNKGLMKKLTLASTNPSKETCLIYSETEKTEFKTLSLSAKNNDLTLLEIQGSSPGTFPALLSGGKLILGSQKPTANCLALYDHLGKFLVVGVYEASGEKFIPFSAITSLDPFIDYLPTVSSQRSASTEQFFVLENQSMQLVFSNLGGALCEVNLPIKNEAHPDSVILPVGEDKLIKKQAPLSDLFPLHAYKKSVGGKIEQFEPYEGGYYTLLRRAITRKDPRASSRVPAKFYAANVISDDETLASLTYSVKSMTDKQIVFTASYKGRKITKTFELPTNGEEAPYVVLATVDVQGDKRGLYFTSGVPEVEFVAGRVAPSIHYTAYDGSDLKTHTFKLPKSSSQLDGATPDWTSNSNGYFSVIVDPLDKVKSGFTSTFVPGEEVPSRITLIDSLSDRYPAAKYPGYQVSIPLSGQEPSTTFRLYLGPLDAKVLAKVDSFYTNEVTGYSPQYNKALTYQGFLMTVVEPFARLLSLFLNWCYKISHSWGLAIILLTILLRLILYPLNAWSIKSMIGLKVVAPETKKLQERYKKDPMRLRAETMKLYKEHGVNPIGCIVPLFLQMPFLFGMFSVLKSTFGIRGASFIPGWITNLSEPDVLFSWGLSLPFLGSSFHLLPVLSSVLMYFQSKQSSAKGDVSQMSEMERSQQKMSWMMPVIMLVVFYNMPSGLNLYFISASALQMLQHVITQKAIEKKRLKKNPKEVTIKVKK